jgi:hypothetical protein
MCDHGMSWCSSRGRWQWRILSSSSRARRGWGWGRYLDIIWRGLRQEDCDVGWTEPDNGPVLLCEDGEKGANIGLASVVGALGRAPCTCTLNATSATMSITTMGSRARGASLEECGLAEHVGQVIFTHMFNHSRFTWWEGNNFRASLADPVKGCTDLARSVRISDTVLPARVVNNIQRPG